MSIHKYWVDDPFTGKKVLRADVPLDQRVSQDEVNKKVWAIQVGEKRDRKEGHWGYWFHINDKFKSYVRRRMPKGSKMQKVKIIEHKRSDGSISEQRIEL